MSVENTAGVYAPQSLNQVRGAVGGTSAFWMAKRLFDLAMSLALLVFLIPLALLLLLLNPWLNRGPLFYLQQRMGRDLKPFMAIKFRSMLPAETITRSAEDPIEADRITRLGLVIRKIRIDELPQILNVLRGEMSLVGPRPDYFEHAREFIARIPEYEARHVVRPGISGFAQVTLGYAEGIDATRAKANADLAYIRNAGLALEARIFWLTLKTVFLRKGA